MKTSFPWHGLLNEGKVFSQPTTSTFAKKFHYRNKNWITDPYFQSEKTWSHFLVLALSTLWHSGVEQRWEIHHGPLPIVTIPYFKVNWSLSQIIAFHSNSLNREPDSLMLQSTSYKSDWRSSLSFLNIFNFFEEPLSLTWKIFLYLVALAHSRVKIAG